jgi:cytochrome o ubiquinol oxidase subunit 2
MKRNFVLPIIAGLVMLGIILLAYIHRADISVLNPQGIIALQERGVFIATLALSAIVVVPIFIMLFAFAWKYRADSPKAIAKHSPNWDHDSWWTEEFVWWLVPGAIVIVLAVIAWQSSNQLDPYRPIVSQNAPVTVQVIALDWKWLFIYPQQNIATVNYLEIPENTPIHFDITADAPMNSFWIPSLGGQIMAMAGMTNQLYLLAAHTGTFRGLSANISGEGFSGMNFPVKSVSQIDFESWVSSVRSQQSTLNSATYAALSEPSSNVPPGYYSSIDPQLYTATIMKYMMAATSTMSTSTSAATTGAMPSMTNMNM